MNYYQRYFELNLAFKWDMNTYLGETGTKISFHHFESRPETHSGIYTDELIDENYSFSYPVFSPASMKKFDRAILLLHGLNERNWNKYLTWAEEICLRTGKPVILFPIAFHMNRSPRNWSKPRALQQLLDLRKQRIGNDRTMSIANLALSERISEEPRRFYCSGRQSLNDITQLIQSIKSGKHPLFKKETKVDMFAYSIGAFLSQVIFMSNPLNLFSESKLFMFCGGSIFSSMFGESRNILDKVAFEKMKKYYQAEFDIEKESDMLKDKHLESFNTMLLPERNKSERLDFFKKLGERICGISLCRDIVIPYPGIEEAIGKETAKKHIKLVDFSFDYSHENPFPTTGKIDTSELNLAFNKVFGAAADFLT